MACGIFSERFRPGRIFDLRLLTVSHSSPVLNPDRFLVVLRSPEVGRLLVGEPKWSSEDVWVIAMSGRAEEQEAMLLMAAHGWLRTSVGKYSLKPVDTQPWRARLQLEVSADSPAHGGAGCQSVSPLRRGGTYRKRPPFSPLALYLGRGGPARAG